MKLKNEINQKKDIMYLSIAILLTAALATYLFWFVHHLVQKADFVFSTNSAPTHVIAFDFDRYDRVLLKVFTATSTTIIHTSSTTSAVSASTTASSSTR